MSEYYDDLELRSPEAREAALMAALPAQIAHAQHSSSAFAQILQGVDASSIRSREALAQLPVTRKYELLERQKAQRASSPFGGFNACSFGPGCLASLPAPALFTSQKVRSVTTGAWRVPSMLRAFAPVSWFTTVSATTLCLLAP